MPLAKVDPKDPRVLYIEWINGGDRPMTALPNSASIDPLTWKKNEELRSFRLFMVTRRSIVNPDEVCKMKIVLAVPFFEYSEYASLQLSYPGIEIRFHLNPKNGVVKR